MGPTGQTAVIQIHPTRRCNLTCRHCYSLSGPGERDQLDVALLSAALNDAAVEGYGAVSVSGGEPLLYRPLAALLAHARDIGLRTAVTTNGMLLTERRLNELTGLLDLIAFSIDGIPEAHNHIRRSPIAFKKMVSRLPAVRASGIRFGFIFTLTQSNVDQLEWVAEFAAAEGAGLLQIHPLEEVGRAVDDMPELAPDAIEGSVALLEAARIQARYAGRLQVQLDLSARSALRRNPERVYATPSTGGVNTPLARLVSPLIVEADGSVVPLQYGFDRRYALGNLRDASLSELATAWKRASLQTFRQLAGEVYRSAVDGGPVIVNWYELMRVGAAQAVSASAA